MDTGELVLLGNGLLLVMDESLKAVAKLSFKGNWCDYADGHLLTITEGSHLMGYDPSSVVRIYQICRK